jgi:hypothetical protein
MSSLRPTVDRLKRTVCADGRMHVVRLPVGMEPDEAARSIGLDTGNDDVIYVAAFCQDAAPALVATLPVKLNRAGLA